MDKRSFSYFVSGLLIGLLAATIVFSIVLRQRAGTAESRRTVLKLGHGLDTTHPVHAAFEFMKERLEELSGGRVTLDIYPGGVLGSETESIEQLQQGTLDLTKTSAGPLESFVPEMTLFSLPYVFADDAHYWKVLDGELGRRLLVTVEPVGLHGLCYYDAGSRNFYTARKPVLKPEDLTGLKIRVQNSRTAMDMVSALGGSPTPIAWGELYTALQQGTVDGAENNPPSFMCNRHYEVCKHFTLNEHTRMPDILLISLRVWERLDPRTQQWIRQAAEDSSRFQRALWREKTDEAIAAMKKEGVGVYAADKEAFEEKVRGLLESHGGTVVGDMIEEIRAMRETP